MRLRHRHDDESRTDETAGPVTAERSPEGDREPGFLGRWRHRDEPPTDDRSAADRAAGQRAGAEHPAADRDTARAEARERTDTARAEEREETVETVRPRRDVASLLPVVAGALLIIVGAVALVRTGIDGSWYDPVVQVAGIGHTALLGLAEVVVGALLVVAGLVHARVAAAVVALVAGIGAAVAAIEPDAVERELALERGWAIVLAVAGILIALVLVMAGSRGEERRIERRRPVTT